MNPAAMAGLFVPFMGCVQIHRMDCASGWNTLTGRYEVALMPPFEAKGFVRLKPLTLTRDQGGERAEGGLIFEVHSQIYTTDEDDGAFADVIDYQGRAYRVISVVYDGCVSRGEAGLLSADKCSKYGIAITRAG